MHIFRFPVDRSVAVLYDPCSWKSYFQDIEIFHGSHMFLPCSFSDPLTETAAAGLNLSHAGYSITWWVEMCNKTPNIFSIVCMPVTALISGWGRNYYIFSMCRYAQSCAFISVIELPRIPAYYPKKFKSFCILSISDSYRLLNWTVFNFYSI